MFDPEPNWHERLPPEPALERLGQEEVALWPDISDAEKIGWGWSLLVSDRDEEIEDRARNIPGFSWSSVGILDPSVDRYLDDSDPHFGIILYTEDPSGESGGRLEGLDFDWLQLPMVVRNVHFQSQQSTSIGHGRVACWATSREGSRQGWLTARHVATHSQMQGRVVDQGRACMDVALVDIGRSGAGNHCYAVPPTVGASILLDLGAPRPSSVLDIGTNCGIRSSSHFPLRFTFGTAGVPGDSGGLILADPCGEPMGIYLGAYELEGSRPGGVGQALTQVEYLMNLEAFL